MLVSRSSTSIMRTEISHVVERGRVQKSGLLDFAFSAEVSICLLDLDFGTEIKSHYNLLPPNICKNVGI